MARIPADEVERLEREISGERLAVAAGVELEKRGADWWAAALSTRTGRRRSS